ncbi:MAG TPA: hypothetical protein VL728_08790, partial [Cyclobacteriaceae bacterium]|nr:hypothetical protein [Cyclobacteriaceae bacterium]
MKQLSAGGAGPFDNPCECAANELVRFAKTQAAQEGFCGLRPQNISSAVAAASGNRTKNARAVYI